MKSLEIRIDHPAVIEHGENWCRFRALSPNILDEVVPIGLLIDQLSKEPNDIWYVSIVDDVQSIVPKWIEFNYPEP